MKKESALLSLSAFRELSGLSAESVIQLIEQRLVDLELDQEQGLLIDANTANNQSLLAAVRAARAASTKKCAALLEEQISSVVSAELERIIELAILELKR